MYTNTLSTSFGRKLQLKDGSPNYTCEQFFFLLDERDETFIAALTKTLATKCYRLQLC